MKTTLTKKLLLLSGIFLSLFLYMMPTFAFAVEDPDSVGKTGITYVCKDNECTFDDVVAAIQKVIGYAIKFGLMFSVLVIAKVGWIYLNSGGSASERKKAQEMMEKVVIGIAWMLGAWLVVTLIAGSLLRDDLVKLGLSTYLSNNV